MARARVPRSRPRGRRRHNRSIPPHPWTLELAGNVAPDSCEALVDRLRTGSESGSGLDAPHDHRTEADNGLAAGDDRTTRDHNSRDHRNHARDHRGRDDGSDNGPDASLTVGSAP